MPLTWLYEITSDFIQQYNKFHSEVGSWVLHAPQPVPFVRPSHLCEPTTTIP